ncbi:hypothetical protein AVEN_260267-1 [Araneus ventricosus]|uniref:Uncharacterized protein n=1 Tax=Araneus ventricosus TaxID=182803 RepID=A0A4Y2FR41_ARAVE|nr:hypothetical protein AVEN_164248-1 [Araneus ventricosus]GBM42104.1 hypothetical protein AVEN_260267-1 [Araneus ventricosus]
MSFLNQADQVSNLEGSFTETVRRSRNSFLNEKDRKRNTAKINRTEGKAYMGFRRADLKTTKWIVQVVSREKRKIGFACRSRKCQESRKKGCDTILEQETQSLFDEFWLIMSWDLKILFVRSTVDIKSTKRKDDDIVQSNCNKKTRMVTLIRVVPIF